MAYLRAYQAAGDPWLGGVFKGVLGLGKKLLGLGGGGGISKGALADAMKTALAKGTAGAGKIAGRFPGGKKGALLAGGALAGGALAGAGAEAMFGRGGRRSYRRMNVGNTRALRRAMRRVQGFAHLAHQTMTFTKTHHLKKRRGRK